MEVTVSQDAASKRGRAMNSISGKIIRVLNILTIRLSYEHNICTREKYNDKYNFSFFLFLCINQTMFEMIKIITAD